MIVFVIAGTIAVGIILLVFLVLSLFHNEAVYRARMRAIDDGTYNQLPSYDAMFFSRKNPYGLVSKLEVMGRIKEPKE